MAVFPQPTWGPAADAPQEGPWEVMRTLQRERLFVALAETVAVKGYAATTVADVLSASGMARRTFYQHFESKEDCFLAAYEEGLRRPLAAAGGAYAAGAPWPQRMVAALDGLLGELAARPALARLCVVDVLAAGPDAVARHHTTLERLRPAFDEGRRHASPALPATLADATLATIGGILFAAISGERPAYLPDLLPDLALAVLAPYVGPAAALQAVEAHAPTPGPVAELRRAGAARA